MTNAQLMSIATEAGQNVKARGGSRSTNPWNMMAHCEKAAAAWYAGYDA